MKKFLLTISVSLSFGFVSAASFHDSIKIVKSDGSSFSCPVALMDSIVSDMEQQNVFLSIPRSEIKEIIEEIKRRVKEEEPKYTLVIKIDRPYVE